MHPASTVLVSPRSGRAAHGPGPVLLMTLTCANFTLDKLVIQWISVVIKAPGVLRMEYASAIIHIRGLQSNRARVIYALDVLAGLAKVPRSARTRLRSNISGIYKRDGMVLELRPGTMDPWVVHPGHERETHAWVSGAFREKGGLMIDVGAFCGTFSLFHRDLFDQILAFEPNPINYQALTRNLALSERASHILAIQSAVAARSGTAQFFLNTYDTGSLVTGSGPTIDVPLTMIDEQMKEIAPKRLRLVKVDVEGAEIDVLKGADATLRAASPYLILEANSPAHAVALADHLAPLGYNLTMTVDQRNLIFAK